MRINWESKGTWRVESDEGELIANSLLEVHINVPSRLATIQPLQGWVYVDNGTLRVEDQIGYIE